MMVGCGQRTSCAQGTQTVHAGGRREKRKVKYGSFGEERRCQIRDVQPYDVRPEARTRSQDVTGHATPTPPPMVGMAIVSGTSAAQHVDFEGV
jgi:hypothetical protein